MERVNVWNLINKPVLGNDLAKLFPISSRVVPNAIRGFKYTNYNILHKLCPLSQNGWSNNAINYKLFLALHKGVNYLELFDRADTAPAPNLQPSNRKTKCSKKLGNLEDFWTDVLSNTEKNTEYDNYQWGVRSSER